jgi:hypothetical protein
MQNFGILFPEESPTFHIVSRIHVTMLLLKTTRKWLGQMNLISNTARDKEHHLFHFVP